MTLPSYGPWTLPIEGFEVLQITFAYPIDLVAYVDGGASAIIRFENRFDFADADDLRHLDASSQSWQELAVLLSLRHDRTATATATEDDAQLRIDFESGRVLTAGPHPNYENWAVEQCRRSWRQPASVVNKKRAPILRVTRPAPRGCVGGDDAGNRAAAC